MIRQSSPMTNLVEAGPMETNTYPKKPTPFPALQAVRHLIEHRVVLGLHCLKNERYRKFYIFLD
jgi:hypothetical protein